MEFCFAPHLFVLLSEFTLWRSWLEIDFSNLNVAMFIVAGGHGFGYCFAADGKFWNIVGHFQATPIRDST